MVSGCSMVLYSAPRLITRPSIGTGRNEGVLMQPGQRDVTAVVVHYETPDVLGRCLDGLRMTKDVSLETIVVDNASIGFTDESPHACPVRMWFATQRTLVSRQLPTRDSYCRRPLPAAAQSGHDCAARHTRDAGCVSRPTSGGLRYRPPKFAGRHSRPGLPAPIPDARARALPHVHAVTALPAQPELRPVQPDLPARRRETEIDAPCGAFMMVRAEIRESVGLLDERYFMYGEDLDWAYRIKGSGWKVVYYPEAVAVHLKRASSANRPDDTRFLRGHAYLLRRPLRESLPSIVVMAHLPRDRRA